MFEQQAFANTVPGVGISPAFAPMTFGARQQTGAVAVMEPVAGAYDPARQVTVEDGAPLALAAAERTPYNTTEDSQTWVDREA